MKSDFGLTRNVLQNILSGQNAVETQYSNLLIQLSRPIPVLPFKFTLACLLLGLLSACVSGPPKSVDEIVSDAVRNQPSETLTDDTEAQSAEYYIRLASESTGAQRQQHLLKAAELLYQRGDIQSASSQLQHLDAAQLENVRQVQIQLLAAKIAIANNNPTQALELLPAPDGLTQPQLIETRKVRADASLALGNPMQAVHIRIDLERYLQTDDEKAQNHEAIWSALSQVPGVDLKASPGDDADTRGWIDLALVMRKAQTDISWLQQDILDWGTRYPLHPVSNSFIARLIDDYLKDYTPAQGVAVLLPMQGRYQAASDAIRGGIISAWYNEGHIDKPMLRFYDTGNEESDFEQLYQKALSDGASYVIGPLDKSTVSRLAQQHELELPVLTLNYAENPLSSTINLFQFGLLPEDEATQVADMAIRNGNTRAAVLIPNSDWGRRLYTAFTRRFEALGGSVLVVQQYGADVDDYSHPLKRMLNLDDSEDRHRSLEKLLGTRLEFTPYRRHDIDMLFLVATSRSARGIMPALKFHHAGDLPVYATSHVYPGQVDRAGDRDLNGLVFCDTPWTLVADDKMKQIFDSDWSDQQTYTRLFALGVDAYHLIRNLKYLQSHEFARFAGETGNISMDQNQRLHRELLWAKFSRGVPVYLDTTTPTAIAQPAESDQINADETTPDQP
jgi:outer membrane PBP1 activator LpoA protein